LEAKFGRYKTFVFNAYDGPSFLPQNEASTRQSVHDKRALHAVLFFIPTIVSGAVYARMFVYVIVSRTNKRRI